MPQLLGNSKGSKFVLQLLNLIQINLFLGAVEQQYPDCDNKHVLIAQPSSARPLSDGSLSSCSWWVVIDIFELSSFALC